MKTTLKNYLKFGVLLFGVSLILTNCEKDDDNQPKSDLLNKNKSINQTSLSELLNQNFLSEETFGLMAKKQNTSLNDKATEPTFKLSSSKGLKYLDKGNTYHVFLMERTDKTDPYYYNLVVHEHEETLEKYIYKYPLDKTENVTISKITNKDIQSARKSVPVPVVKDLGDGCTETYLYDVTPCPCVGHIDPNICTCPIKPAWKFKGGPYYYCPALDTNNPIIVMPDNNNGVNTSKGITTNDPGGCFSNGNGMTECEPLDERPILLVPLPVFEPDFGKNEGITSTLELSNVQKLWLEKLENLNFKSDIEEYLNQYVFTNKFNQAKAFAISAIDILSLPVITSNNKIDYAEEILRLTNHLKSFGNIEDEIYADYIQSLIPEFNNMTINEVRAIYGHVKTTCNNLTIKYLKEIITPIVTDLVIPVITYALFEATAGTAVKLLQKIPLPLVLRGARLNNLILKTTELGNPGFGNARLIPNSTVAKAEALFASLTKDAISVVPAANNPAITVAHMGNGMKIILRPISQTVPSAVRVIEYQNFNTLLGVDSFSLKFIP